MESLNVSFSSPSIGFRGRLATLLLGLLVMVSARTGMAREIVDMAGRHVQVPDQITRVYAAQPYTYVLTMALAPDLLVGVPAPLSEGEKRFLPESVAKLPVLGNGMGPGAQTNLEAVLALRPDIALVKGGKGSENKALEERFARLGLPVVYVDIDRIDDYPAGLAFAGQLLGRRERGEALAGYARRVIQEVDQVVAAIPPEKRVRVYYAESADGLATECADSFHADAIRRAGGELVHRCVMMEHVGMAKVSMEQILAYDPPVIVANDPHFVEQVRTDERWRGVAAIRSGRILTVPRTPFNWIDRPPTITRLMGMQWLLHRLYPERYPLDLAKVTREFQERFFGVSLSEGQLQELLGPRP